MIDVSVYVCLSVQVIAYVQLQQILTYARICRIRTAPGLAGWTGGCGPRMSDYTS